MTSLRVVALMKDADAIVCAAGAYALWHHTAIDGKAAEVVKAGGVEALVAALSAHLGDAEVCTRVAAALCELALNGKAAEVMASVPLLVQVHRNHSGNAKRLAGIALDALGYTNDGKKK